MQSPARDMRTKDIYRGHKLIMNSHKLRICSHDLLIRSLVLVNLGHTELIRCLVLIELKQENELEQRGHDLVNRGN